MMDRASSASTVVRPAAAADVAVREHRRLRPYNYLKTDAPLYYYSFTDAGHSDGQIR